MWVLLKVIDGAGSRGIFKSMERFLSGVLPVPRDRSMHVFGITGLRGRTEDFLKSLDQTLQPQRVGSVSGVHAAPENLNLNSEKLLGPGLQ